MVKPENSGETRVRLRDRPFSDQVPESVRLERLRAAARPPNRPHGIRRRAIAASAPWRALPDFLIIGAQKSGTTSLFQYLAQHPRLLRSRFKEPAFLHHWSGKGSLNRYRRQFPLEFTRRIRRGLCFEATPESLFFPHTPLRARALPGERKFIAILRNPVDRALSHYAHMLSHQRVTEPIESFIEMVPSMDEDYVYSASDPLGWGHAQPGYDMIARGIYDVQLARWFDTFGRDMVKVYLFDDFKRAPNEVLAQICNFVGVEPIEFDTRKIHYRGFRADTAPATRRALETRFAAANHRLEKLLGKTLPWQ